MIRCQMNCADNNCSRPRSSEEETVLRDALVTDAVFKRWELTLGFKDTGTEICIGDLHRREWPGCESR